MKDHIIKLGKSNLNLAQKMEGVKFMELPRIDYRMMCADLKQCDLENFDRWLRGQIQSWFHMRGVDDEGVKVHVMTPFAQRYRKSKDDSIRTRQLTFPGAPPPERRSRPPLETRKRWGGSEYRQTRLVDDVVSGEKITAVYDPTQRITQIDPDVEAEVTGSDRVVPGDTFKRTVTWVWPDGTMTIINKLNIPVRATSQDLLYRICRALKTPELNHMFTIITPEDWKYARAIRVEFTYERPELSFLREVTEKQFGEDYDETLPVFIETDGACAGNADKQSPGGWSAIIVQGARMLKRFGSRADTSNNEMEYWAMLEALRFVSEKAFVVMETDS
jgi:hypothetical protein